MSSIAALNSFSSDFRELSAKAQDSEISQLDRISTVQHQSSGLTIVTDEGDRVTLSSSADFQAGFATYDSRGNMNGDYTAMQASAFSFSASRSMAISVEGNLSKEELEDINKVIKQTEKIMKDFLYGDMDKVLERTLKMSQLDTIAILETSFDFSQTVTTEQGMLISGIFSEPPTPEEVAGAEGAKINPTSIVEVLDDMTEVVENSGIQLNKIFKPFDKMFSRIFRNISEVEEPEHNASRLKLAKFIKADFLKKIGLGGFLEFQGTQ